jgi:hypothetical protein
MSKKAVWAFLVLSLLTVASIGPGCGADYEIKDEQVNPDEMWFGLEGMTFDEDKDMERSGSGGQSSSSSKYNVTVEMLKKGDKSRESGTINFPYEKFGWSIDSWYKSAYGLRFYGVYYEDEKILYDYRIPWVKIEDGPDLSVWKNLKIFKVWTKYSIPEEDVDIQVYAYFYDDGEFDPWAIVDAKGTAKDIVVAQRFDFDLDGSSDDNAKFFTDTPAGDRWELVEEEDDHPDAGQPEDDNVQWQLFDTDVQGLEAVVDQLAELVPYHPDDSTLSIVRYHWSEIRGDPGDYLTNETTGLYRVGTYDPYEGYDLVAWYVSEYDDEDWCNPGPWILLTV